MGALSGVRLNLLRSDIGCRGEGRQSFELNEGFTQSPRRFSGELNEASRMKRPIQPSGIILKVLFDFVVTFCLSFHIRLAAFVRPAYVVSLTVTPEFTT
jgi:hypothetical protein